MGRDANGDITNHMVMARTKTEEKQANEGPKSPKKKNLVSYPFKFVEKNHNKKSLEGRFQNKIQTAFDGTENTVKSNTGKTIHRKFILYTGTIVSDREEEPKGYGNNKCRNITQKPPLPERITRKVRPMG